ncbi:methyltransferase domain-containing protein [Roseivirga sp.]|uniref:methyltransferase domain-containing protein n=1 Tax=Roseivirga sp. TaxID=1964215 RepID=UPI003B52A593
MCPLSGKALRPITSGELAIVNQKIANGELYFHPGIQVNRELEDAYVTVNQTYFYPVINDMLLLKKDTAVAAKNRTKNPLLRISEQAIQSFYEEYPLLSPERKSTDVHKSVHSKPLTNDQLKELKGLLPKSGDCFMSAVTHDVDALHNLVFNTNFNHYIHLDFSLQRLEAIKSDVKEGTVLVLCENSDLPFIENSVDALFSFDYINGYEKEGQHQAYQELKRVLKESGGSVVLYDKEKPLHAQTQLKNDLLSKKAIGLLAPWKKKKVPSIYFHPVVVSESNDDNSNEYLTKTSLGRQFS